MNFVIIFFLKSFLGNSFDLGENPEIKFIVNFDIEN